MVVSEALSYANYYSAIAALLAIAGGLIFQNYWRKWRRRQKWNSVGKDVVLLHSFPPCREPKPNLGPFNVKLETYFKMTGIEYEVETAQPIGPKGKSPWITFNGKDYSDSQLILEHLSKHFDKDMSKDLSQEQKAVARSLQIMAEEHLYWGLVSWRYEEDQEKKILKFSDLMPAYFRLLFPIIRRMIKMALYYQGLGRHSIEERRHIIKKDILALSHYLDTKPFFMGETPTEVDCCIYGQLSQIVWNTPGSPYEKIIRDECINLYHFCLRIKEKFGVEK